MKCYLCGSEKHFQREGKVRDNSNIKILECIECGLVFLDTQNTNEKFYQENGMLAFDFFKKTNREYNPNNIKETINVLQNERKIQLQKRFAFCLNYIIGKDILDFGSGYAGFLIKAKEFAKSVTGIELEEQVAPIYEEYNIPLMRNLVNGGGKNKYDVITAFHVIEHLQDPIAILKQLASLLKENGKMIIEVPNGNDALLTIFKNKPYQDFIYWSAHLYYFTPYTLKKLGEKAGLKVEFVKGVQRYSFANNLYWLSFGKPAGEKEWGNFIDDSISQYWESSLASVGATDTLMALFSKRD